MATGELENFLTEELKALVRELRSKNQTLDAEKKAVTEERDKLKKEKEEGETKTKAKTENAKLWFWIGLTIFMFVVGSMCGGGR